MNTPELIELIKNQETKSLLMGEDLMPKIFAIAGDQVSLFGLASYPPEARDDVMTGLGMKIKELIPDVSELVMATDTYTAHIDKNGNYTPDEQAVRAKIEAGQQRLSELAPKYHKFRSEALLIVTRDRAGQGKMIVMPYVRVGKIVEFKDDLMVEKDFEDNLLRLVWKGFYGV